MAKKLERYRQDAVNKTLLAVAEWLEGHARMELVEFYCPSKSGPAACNNAAAALRLQVTGRISDRRTESGHAQTGLHMKPPESL